MISRTDEWRRGWRVILGCAIGAGTGIGLLFFTFSIFNLPLIEELNGTRGDLANIQALVVLGAVGSPMAGWAADRFGVRRVFVAAMLAVVAIELSIAFFVQSMTGLAVGMMLIGLFGVGTTAVTTTRAVNAWFETSRGLALGIAACGTALSTIIVPPILEYIVSTYGWRGGFVGLAALAALIGLPAVYILVEDEPSETCRHRKSNRENSFSFLRESDFWLLAFSLMAIGAALTGFIGQLSPMIQGEGLNPRLASFAVSTFAAGTLIGRLGGGWCLDRFNPRNVAILLGALPASGLLMLWGFQGSLAIALGAAFLIGFQQGAEIDIFAYFTAHRFGIAQYGTIYGALVGLSWLGNAAGLVGVGILHDMSGNYAAAQLASAIAIFVGATLIASIRLPVRSPAGGQDLH